MGVSAPRARRGLSLVEVIVALSILGGVLLALGMFSARLSQATSAVAHSYCGGAACRRPSRDREVRAALLDDREHCTSRRKHHLRSSPATSRRTWVKRVGGAVTDTIDYKIVTVQVTHCPDVGQRAQDDGHRAVLTRRRHAWTTERAERDRYRDAAQQLTRQRPPRSARLHADRDHDLDDVDAHGHRAEHAALPQAGECGGVAVGPARRAAELALRGVDARARVARRGRRRRRCCSRCS